jgi:hypothetical protein
MKQLLVALCLLFSNHSFALTAENVGIDGTYICQNVRAINYLLPDAKQENVATDTGLIKFVIQRETVKTIYPANDSNPVVNDYIGDWSWHEREDLIAEFDVTGSIPILGWISLWMGYDNQIVTIRRINQDGIGLRTYQYSCERL